MIDRVVTKVTLTCWTDRDGFWVQEDRKFTESDLAGGRVKKDTVRYGPLSEAECRDVIDALADRGLPGSQHWAQLAMFGPV